jgi:hypothetical protein
LGGYPNLGLDPDDHDSKGSRHFCVVLDIPSRDVNTGIQSFYILYLLRHAGFVVY